MKIKDIRKLNENQLGEKVKELRKELMKLNTQIATGTNPKSPGQVKDIKKTVARIFTTLNEKKRTKDKEDEK